MSRDLDNRAIFFPAAGFMYPRAAMTKENRSPSSPDLAPEAAPGRGKLREYVEALLVALIFLKFANAFVLQTFYIPSSSMESTLLVGDHLFVNRFIYGPDEVFGYPSWLPARPVQRGDVVIFRSKENPSEDVVKRCIGLPGDELEMIAKKLYLDGEPLDETAYVKYIEPLVPARDELAPLVVPDDHYFCFGDNRDNSNDSRFWGPLPAQLVKGRASVIYWSYGAGSEGGVYRGLLSTAGEGGASLGSRVLGVLKLPVRLFQRSRWGRTGQLVR